MDIRRSASRVLACVSLGLLGLASPAGHATSVAPVNVVDLLTHSQTILSGRVEKVTDGFTASGVPYTEVTLKVMDRIRGAEGGTYTFRQFGLDKPRTMPDGRVYLGGRPTGWPTWRKNEVALVFMYPQARRTGLQTTVGLGHGKLSLGNGVAINSFENASLFSNVKAGRGLLDAAERDLLATKRGPVDEKILRKFLHRAVDGQWVQKGSLAHVKH